MKMKRSGGFDGEQLGPLDRYVRIPSRGRCPYSGLSRAFIYGLISAGAIRSAKVPLPGRKSGGCRVIWLSDLIGYLEQHLERPRPAVASKPSRSRG